MTENLWLRAAALKALSDRALQVYAEVRAELDQLMDRGDRKVVYAPDGTKLGAISKSAPKKAATIIDKDAFLAWVKENYADDVDFELEIVGTHEQVTTVLYEHARELVKPVERVTPAMKATVLEASTAYGAPAGPQGELEVPGVKLVEAAESKVSFLPADGALAVVAEMVRDGKVQLPDLFAATVDGES